MFYTIYETTNIIDGKKYIGKHVTQDINDSYLGSGLLLANAIKKHGRQNFSKRVLFVFDNENEMNLKEIELVNEEVVNDQTYYNIALGGQGGSIVLKPGHPLRESTIDKIKEAQSHNSEFYSKLAKEKHKTKSIGMYGRSQSDHQKRRCSETMRGRARSTEEKEKHNKALRATLDDPNYVHPNKGRVPSAEERNRISEGMKKVPKKTCQHCGKIMDPANYARYHGDKCKSKPSDDVI